MASIYWSGLYISGTVSESGDGWNEPHTVEVSIDEVEVSDQDEFHAESEEWGGLSPEELVDKFRDTVEERLIEDHVDNHDDY